MNSYGIMHLNSTELKNNIKQSYFKEFLHFLPVKNFITFTFSPETKKCGFAPAFFNLLLVCELMSIVIDGSVVVTAGCIIKRAEIVCKLG